ncbi:hypothetical protein BED47_00665 [Gottfriedia luciferensis]|uniref:GIY-YIG homing endonuclease n=1 Tax=Gottfriedia luciferensis TaxID=178774 RepID=A0ABX2ZX03_9BACI|nr:hypothetical protein [Gottfriedia luciferensis]ODG93716.1 hypothetical protein BED47_00665 [Gottfriedia luciferensis]
MVKHFEVNLQAKSGGLNLTKDNYIEKINFKSSRVKNIFTDSMIKDHLEDCLYNYEVNMRYFKSLSKEDFNEELTSFLNKNNDFKEITDLNSIAGQSGYYIMVLDEYSQVYIGTGDIKKRIMQHWSKQFYFDRMINGNKENSILSIDSFRALDTTRIFVYQTEKTLILENEFIIQFDNKYSLNRTKGGALDGLWEAIANRKTRDMSL